MSEFIHDHERVEFVKQQHLNEIINESAMGSRMMQRPGSVGAFSQSVRPGTGQRKARTNLASAKVRNEGDLQKIYGNIDDLVGLEEQQLGSLMN